MRISLLSDTELSAEVMRLARCEREMAAGLIAHLVEFDARGLYLGAGCRSLFNYCVEVLRLSEHEAYNRIEAARLVRSFPVILDRLGDGALNMTTVRLLAPHLTPENHEELMAAAAGKTKREVEEVIVRFFPRPDVPSSMRKVPAPHRSSDSTGGHEVTVTEADPAQRAGPIIRATGAIGAVARDSGGPGSGDPQQFGPVEGMDVLHDAGSVADLEATGAEAAGAPIAFAPRRELLRPLAPDRYEVRFTTSAETCEKIRLAKDLLRHANPHVDTADVVERAVALLLEDLARKKFAATARPRPGRETTPGTRRIPAAVKRTVWRRDSGRCAFVAESGRRCTARGFLEFHHVRPYGVGGEGTADNIQIRCRRHNAYEADLFYGRLVPERVDGATADSFQNELMAVRRTGRR
jgi:hypothetical protein